MAPPPGCGTRKSFKTLCSLDRSAAIGYNAGVLGKQKTRGARRDAIANEAMIHLDHLYRVALHLVKEPTDAEDLVQETFVRALAAHDQFGPGTNMKAWLTKILHNFFFDQYRQRKRWISAEEVVEPESGYREPGSADNPGPENHALRKELSSQIRVVLNQIPEEFRAPIVLVDMGDFSYEEAAGILSCPIGTIRSRLSRGRRLLRQYLRAYVGSEKGGSTQK